jgi:uncharacterized membrane protein
MALNRGGYSFSVGALALLSALLVALSRNATSPLAMPLMGATLVMVFACFLSATRLYGRPAAITFFLVSTLIGWFAEQMGSSRGWFFGRYTYTDVLGTQLGNVPLVIPLMWFSLCHVGLVMANLILHQSPFSCPRNIAAAAFAALIAAMIVTAFDLGADPYFVFVLKAWVMQKTDGAWFGETVQGFAGWMLIGFIIGFLFLMFMRNAPTSDARPPQWATLVPLCIYAGFIVFQIALGHPVETRSIAVFAMGIPLLCAAHGWVVWRRSAGGF